jgi:hypothetical protein
MTNCNTWLFVPDAGEESEKAEDDEWESQQIRKGVTGAQVCHVVLPYSPVMLACDP